MCGYKGSVVMLMPAMLTLNGTRNDLRRLCMPNSTTLDFPKLKARPIRLSKRRNLDEQFSNVWIAFFKSEEGSSV